MKKNVQICPGGVTTLGAKIGIVVASLMLVFGLVFFFVVMREIPPSEDALQILIPAFFLIFIGGLVAIIVVYLRVLKTGAKAEAGSLLEFQFESDSNQSGDTGDFDARLRKLAGLHKDGLVTDTEYNEKREALFREKW